jgi:hypothetical protein
MKPTDAVESAAWIGPRLHPFGQDVGAVVPTGFAAYARILHPAWTRWDPKAREVRWSDIAEWSGKIIHAEVQFHAIQPGPGRAVGPSPWDGGPQLGTLSPGQAVALAELLADRTTSPEACWFCLWEGYGYLHPGGMAQQIAVFVRGPRPLARLRLWAARRRLRKTEPRRADAARVNLPNRGYLLFTGSVRDAAGWEDGPNLWWPDDRAWCVASEIDLPYTYVGGSRELIDAILKHPALEALPAELDDGITYDSDRLNPII